ncbi:hypothetical protein CEP54_000093 [Fusarium duplospermum]|uniref:Uncharacterized protein n=1 Tax=Fusarium duplospermum TaxID=1325734 RepID=A0A428R870_9HYPO|nr:hypothetical protein CEP54_000093 [Fusarium duplospermum]
MMLDHDTSTCKKSRTEGHTVKKRYSPVQGIEPWAPRNYSLRTKEYNIHFPIGSKKIRSPVQGIEPWAPRFKMISQLKDESAKC